MVLLLAAGTPVWAQPPAVMAFGDSLTAGYGLMDHEGLVPQLRDWLAAQGQDIRVIGAGVSGDTTAGGLARLDWSLTPEVRGLIVTLGGNDALRGIDPAVSRENLRGILQIAADRDIAVLLVGMPAPVNFGPDYQAAFAAMYPDLAQEFGALYFPDFFAGLGDGAPADLQHLFQSDGIHPNGAGVALIVGALGPSVLELIERAEQAD
ncbi:arylesterase [Thalassovita sp.]|uniref:arylesterase n=1 Tax=Thalassovita sp. TaxID=1979401 RepID=UPI0029DE5270|nr:arylesterase [Thalassovita sp.]